MALSLKNAVGVGSIAGASILTVSANRVITMIGCRASNKDPAGMHTFHIKVNDTLINGLNTPLPVGSAMDILVGSKVVLEAGDVVTAFSDAEDAVDVFVSYLEQVI